MAAETIGTKKVRREAPAPRFADCAKCGGTYIKLSNRTKYCPACRKVARAEYTLKARLKRNAKPKMERDAQRASFLSSNAQYRREYHRQWRLKNGVKPLSDPVVCQRCGSTFIRHAGGQKVCSLCLPQARRERSKASAGSWNRSNKHDRNERARIRYRESVETRLHHVMSVGIWRTLRGKKGGRKWLSLVPYGVDELRRHLERQFLPGMSWENWGDGPDDWHIDHIQPKVSFVFDAPEGAEFAACWGLSNLRPAWASVNLSKNRKRVYLL